MPCSMIRRDNTVYNGFPHDNMLRQRLLSNDSIQPINHQQTNYDALQPLLSIQPRQHCGTHLNSTLHRSQPALLTNIPIRPWLTLILLNRIRPRRKTNNIPITSKSFLECIPFTTFPVAAGPGVASLMNRPTPFPPFLILLMLFPLTSVSRARTVPARRTQRVAVGDGVSKDPRADDAQKQRLERQCGTLCCHH